MELFAFREANDRSSYLQNVASTIKREQANANAALYNAASVPTGNTSSSTTIAARRARPQSVANGDAAGAARGRGRPGRPRSTPAVSNMSSASGRPAAGATTNNNNPNFASMNNSTANTNTSGGIMSAEMIINLQRQHQRNAQQHHQHQQALAIRQRQQHALHIQQAKLQKYAQANNLNQDQIRALIAANPFMFNPNGNVSAQMPVRPTSSSAPIPAQQARINKTQSQQQQQQNRQPNAQQVPRQNAVAAAQFPIVRQKLVSFFKTYKDDFNIIVSRLPAFVQATDPSKRDLVKKRLKAAHALFEAIRSNRVPLSVTEELVDGHSNFMAMVIRWFKQTHPNIFTNANAANANLNLNNAVSATIVKQQPQRAAPSNANANRTKVENVQNNAAVQHARATAVAQAAAQAQAKAAEQKHLLLAQRQRVARAQLEARRAQQLAAQQAAAAVPQQPSAQTAPAPVRSNAAPVIPGKSNPVVAAAATQVAQRQANAQKKLPVGNRNGSPAGIAKNRPVNPKGIPSTAGTTARAPQKKITKEQYLALLEKRVNSIFSVCEKIEKNASQQAIAVEKAAEEMKRKRVRYSILSLQKFMKETREAVYGKENKDNGNGSMGIGGTGDKIFQGEKKNKNLVCTGEGGLYISESKARKNCGEKSNNNNTRELNNLREVVIADCRAARGKSASTGIGMDIDVSEEYGLPVVTCQLLIPEMKMPKLTIRVGRGYPTISAVTYKLATPALGWKGPLKKVRNELRKRIHKQSPVASGMGVAGLLDAWASVSSEFIVHNTHTSEEQQQEFKGDSNNNMETTGNEIDMGIMA